VGCANGIADAEAASPLAGLATSGVDEPLRDTGFGSPSLLDLSFTRDGEELLHRSFTDAASPTCARDDATFDLGSLVTPGNPLSERVLSFALELPSGVHPASFDLDFALFAPTPVPEPVTGLLLLFAGAGLAAARRRR
jgi:hypothetical protein